MSAEFASLKNKRFRLTTSQVPDTGTSRYPETRYGIKILGLPKRKRNTEKKPIFDVPIDPFPIPSPKGDYKNSLSISFCFRGSYSARTLERSRQLNLMAIECVLKVKLQIKKSAPEDNLLRIVRCIDCSAAVRLLSPFPSKAQGLQEQGLNP